MISMKLMFGWVLSPEEFKESFPKYEEDLDYFHNLAYVKGVFFGVPIKDLHYGNPVNISEAIVDFLANAEEFADQFASILRKNGQSWGKEDKWYSPQVYTVEVSK